MSRFFIDRPIFAWVLAIIIMVAGVIAITRLPVAQYPNIAPPAVTVSASYPGASAQVVEQSVTQIIEQGMKGLDGLIYMSATSESSEMEITRAPAAAASSGATATAYPKTL